MTAVQKIKTFLQQSMIARIALYAIALIFPAGFALFMDEPVIHMFFMILYGLDFTAVCCCSGCIIKKPGRLY